MIKKYSLVSIELVAVLRVKRCALIINILWEANWDEKMTRFRQFKWGLKVDSTRYCACILLFILTRHKGKINIPSFKDIASLVSHLYSASFFSMVLTPVEHTNQTGCVSPLYNIFLHQKANFLLLRIRIRNSWVSPTNGEICASQQPKDSSI